VPSFRHLRPADYRVMPWKNGLGTTTEIAVHPPGAGLDEFTWRLSIADLTASGPFSTFAGYDRILVQIEGAPMTLAHAGREEHRLRLLAPYPFAGELETYGALEAPPARDFNVMVRRDRASAGVSVHELAAGASVGAEGESETRILYVLRGAASVEVAGERLGLGAGESLVAEGASGLAFTAEAEGATVIVVRSGPPALERTTMTTGTAPAAKAKKDSIIKPRRLSHGTLICADLKKTRRFYEEFLGLEVVQHLRSAMMFRLNTGMHVFCIECGPNKLGNMHVLTHWGIDVGTREEVDEAHENALKYKDEYGIQKITKPVPQHGAYSFYFQDLDNNWWEIQCCPVEHEDYFARGDMPDPSP